MCQEISKQRKTNKLSERTKTLFQTVYQRQCLQMMKIRAMETEESETEDENETSHGNDEDHNISMMTKYQQLDLDLNNWNEQK